MQDDSIKIKLFRKGLGGGPEYSITVYDSGRVVYEGIDNVKIKDRIETSIDEEKIVTLLEDLKESGVFNINQNYQISESSNRSYTRLTVEMPGVDEQVKKKSVVHYDDEAMIPRSLKNFEDKIDEIVESYRWVKTSSQDKTLEPNVTKPSSEIKKPEKKVDIKEKNSNKKILKFAVPAIVGLVLIVVLVFFFIGNVSDDLSPSNNYDPPKITSLATKDSIYGLEDSININFEYSNVTHNNTYDILVTLNVYFDVDLLESYSFNIVSPEDLETSYVFSSNDSWDLGEYTVVFELKDEISGLSTSKQTTFTLSKQIPKIIVFTPVDSEPSYQEYTPKSTFDLGDTLYVYVEYTGINTTNDDSECNIFLKINVTDSSGTVYASHSKNKTHVGNNAHYWGFLTDSSWTSKFYYINLYLYDYNTDLSIEDSTYMILNS